MFTLGTIVNLQRASTEKSKNGAITKVRILVEQVTLYLKTFSIISNQMPVLPLILH